MRELAGPARPAPVKLDYAELSLVKLFFSVLPFPLRQSSKLISRDETSDFR